MSGNQYPTPQPRSPWSSPVVIGAIVAGVLVLALAILLGFLLIPSDDSTSTAQDSSTTSGQVTTHTVTAEPSTVTATPSPITTTSTPALPVPNVPGTDQQGFVSGPRCNGPEDTAVMVGQTDQSRIVVCQADNQSGRYYYKGLANGLGVEIPDPTRSGNEFVALNLDTTYEMTPSTLTIATNGVVVSREPMLYYWTN